MRRSTLTLDEAIEIASQGVYAAFQERKSYSPHEPTGKQKDFLALDCREAFYGGAAGGGKSDALLMAALQYVHVPGYAALILRRTFADLSLPDAIMARCEAWLINSDAKWEDKTKTWTFPSGATITFGYLDTEKDKYRYQGAAFQFVGFDELTQFTETQYLYLFSRLRRLVGSEIPLRMRSASNPGGEGHEWVLDRFIDHPGERIFVPASLRDNPHLDAEEYEKSLDELDPVTRAQLLNGDWRVLPAGPLFKREDFTIIDEIPPLALWVRYYDLATSIKEKADETAGSLVGVRANGAIVIADQVCWKREWPDSRDGMREPGQEAPGIIDIVKTDFALMEGLKKQHELTQIPRLYVGVEAQGMQLALVQDLHRNDEFLRVPLHSQLAKGDKKQRASVWAARGKRCGIELVRGAWNKPFIDQCVPFDGEGLLRDDRVDSVSGAIEMIYKNRGGEIDRDKPIKADTWDYWDKQAALLKRINKRR
jgi:hypothetical protein